MLLAAVTALSLSISGCGRLIATIEHPLAGAPAVVSRTGPLQSFQDVAPANLAVYPAGMTMGAGMKQSLSVRVTDQDGQPLAGPVTYESRNASTLGVTADGTVTALSPGKGEVVVSAGGSAMVIAIEVTAALPALTGGALRIAGPSALRVEALGALPQALVAEGATGPVRWVSDNPNVATVDADGRVTAKANGRALITAQANGVSAPLEIMVRQRPVWTRIAAPDGTQALQAAVAGQAVALQATVTDGNRRPVAIAGYQVDVPGVASVDWTGQAAPRAQGQTLVRPRSGGLFGPDRGALTFAVGQAPQPPALGAGGMDVYPARMALVPGGRLAIVAQARDASGAVIKPAFSFAAEPAGIVSVDGNGVVTAIAPGQASVRVTGFRTSRTMPVVVEAGAGTLRTAVPAAITATSFGPLGGPLAPGEAGVAWTSSDPSVATVDGSGRVTALKDGTTTLVATRGAERAALALTVDQRPAYLAVHNTLPGDPREVILNATRSAFGVSATAFDFNGNAMAIEKLVSDDDQAAFVSQDYVTTYSGGSGYVRAICKGVRSNNANSVLVQSMADLAQGSRGEAANAQPGAATFTLSVAQAAVGLTVGGQLTLTATVRDGAGAVTNAVTPSYTVSDPSVATVNAAGQITGVSVGTANVTVAVPGATVTVPVTVTLPAVPGLSVNPTSLTSNALGTVGQLTATTNQGAITWTTSNPAVATVDAAGNLTAAGNGTANIRAAAGALTVDVPVTIDQRAATARVNSTIAGNPSSANVFVGGATTVSSTPRDANNFAVPIVGWVSDDPSVATVDATGAVSYVGDGSTYIRVITRGNVPSPNAESLLLNVATRSLNVAPAAVTSDRLGAAATPIVATTNQGAVTMVSSNPGVVTVDNSGNLVGVSNGTANVTVSAGTSTRVVPVTIDQRATNILVNSALAGNPRNIVFGSTVDGSGNPYQFTVSATATDANGFAVPVVSWQSSNPAVATVHPTTGVVTILTDGNAVISVTTQGGVTSTVAQSITVTVDVNNAGSVDTTINLP
jgi:uncharacterized protein YjdB